MLQAVDDYHRGVVFQLVNRDTGYLLILIVANNTLGYTDGPEVGFTRRTPELSIRKCARPCHRCASYEHQLQSQQEKLSRASVHEHVMQDSLLLMQ